MRIAIVCDSDAKGGCREVHEPVDIHAEVRAELESRLGHLNRRQSVLRHLDDVFEEIEAEMRRRTVRIH
jgi:hypothetical protein